MLRLHHQHCSVLPYAGLIALSLLLIVPSTVFSQRNPSTEDRITQDPREQVPGSLSRPQYELLQITRKSIELRNALETLTRESKTRENEEKISAAQKELSSLSKSFEMIATQLQEEELHEAVPSTADWTKQMEDILRPMLQAVREATEKPRKVDALRAQIDFLEERLDRYNKAREKIAALTEIPKDAALPPTRETAAKETVGARELRETYTKQINSLKTKYDPEILRLKLEETKRQLHDIQISAKSPLSILGDAVGGFFAVRGRNLLASGTVFVGLWWLLAYLFNIFQKKSRDLVQIRGPIRKVFLAVSNLCILAVSVFAGLLTLYLLDDWLMFTLVIIVVSGFAWTFRGQLPQLLKELRIILNLGSVREGERIVWKGVPWLIRELGVRAVLENPLLAGGKIKIPVEQLVGEFSRPFVQNEPWFPCQQGDHLLLADNTFGQVVSQSMEQVILRHRGALKYYSATDFLALKPINLSSGFQHIVEFGLDYGVQNRIGEEIPRLFLEGLKRLLRHHIECIPKKLLSLKVEFGNIAASSLNLIVLADFDGRFAGDYLTFSREIHRALVEICTEQGFTLPFSQITLNLAEDLKKSGVIPTPRKTD